MQPTFRVIIPSSSVSQRPEHHSPSSYTSSPAMSPGSRSPVRLATSSDDRCRYSGRPCPYQRATKRNGESHRMCQLHRERANHTQRRVAERRRERRTPSDDNVLSSDSSTKTAWLPRLESLELDDNEVQEIIDEVWQATKEQHTAR